MPVVLDAAGDLGRAQLDPHPEGFEQVGGTALRRRGAGPVLAHGHAGARHHERRDGRHVDRVAAVPAGTDEIDRPGAQLVGQRHERGRIEDRVEQARHLLGGLPPWPAGPR